MSPGRAILMSLPSRLTCASEAVERERKTSAENSRNSPSSVPRSMSPSRNPRAFASLLNFMPIFMSFIAI